MVLLADETVSVHRAKTLAEARGFEHTIRALDALLDLASTPTKTPAVSWIDPDILRSLSYGSAFRTAGTVVPRADSAAIAHIPEAPVGAGMLDTLWRRSLPVIVSACAVLAVTESPAGSESWMCRYLEGIADSEKDLVHLTSDHSIGQVSDEASVFRDKLVSRFEGLENSFPKLAESTRPFYASRLELLNRAVAGDVSGLKKSLNDERLAAPLESFENVLNSWGCAAPFSGAEEERTSHKVSYETTERDESPGDTTLHNIILATSVASGLGSLFFAWQWDKREQRRNARHVVDLPARLTWNGARMGCVVRDMSATGVRLVIDGDGKVPVGARVSIRWAEHLSEAKVVWSTPASTGLKFNHALSEQVMLEALLLGRPMETAAATPV